MATPEGKVSDGVRATCRTFGYWCLRFEILGIAGYPDMMCFGNGGDIFFIEVKKGGDKPRGLQKVRQRSLTKAGITSEWFDNVNDFHDWLQQRIKGLNDDSSN